MAFESRVDLPSFWRRRARRLLPALFLVLGAVALFAATWAPVDMLDRLRGDALATLGYVANWRFVTSSQSYFAQFTSPSPLQHVWSLAIEEQFYLVWPPVFLMLLHLTRGSRRNAPPRPPSGRPGPETPSWSTGPGTAPTTCCSRPRRRCRRRRGIERARLPTSRRDALACAWTVQSADGSVRRCSATVHAGDNATPTAGNLGAGSSTSMTVSTHPRRLLGKVLALVGLDGGNGRALANARGILDGLHAAREEVDALEARMERSTPRGLRAGWPVTPPAGQPPRPAATGRRTAPAA
jgi:hypothetical protein